YAEKQKWDHAIKLIPGEHKLNYKVYPLNVGEQEQLNTLTKKRLKSGQIHSSKSLFAS
ncbi:hypothetical protein SERLA73DRAFT_26685, partial [Serpula lacrymans var. lacrymans S7.3]